MNGNFEEVKIKPPLQKSDFVPSDSNIFWANQTFYKVSIMYNVTSTT